MSTLLYHVQVVFLRNVYFFGFSSTKIDWLSKEALEAEVTVDDGRFELTCFSQPFNCALNDFIKTSLYCYEISNVIRVGKSEFKVEKLYDSFTYNLTGKLAWYCRNR